MKRLFLIVTAFFIAACSGDSPQETASQTPVPPVEGPTLLAPAHESLVGYHVPLVLEWAWDQSLGENQVYSVHVARAGEPLQDVQWTGDTRYDVRWFAQEGGDYEWQILVLQLANGAYEKTVASSPVRQFTVPASPEALIETFPVPDTQDYPNDCSIVPKTETEKAYLGIEASYHGLTADGVYMFNYGEYAVFQEAGWQSTPYHVGNYGMLGFSAWCSFNDPAGLVIGLKQADWYIKNAVKHKDFATWHYTFANPEFGLFNYWTSAYGNSNAIYLLTDAYAITGEHKYLDYAQLAVNSFQVTMDKNGVSSLMDDGESLIFEETAGPGVAGSRILNVHLLALRALDFYAQYTQDETAQMLVDMGIETVRKYLPAFDVQTMSLYALGPQPQRSNSRFLSFHQQHIEGLLWLYEYTQETVFLDYALRWQQYMFEPYATDTYLNAVLPENRVLQAPDTLETRAGYSVDARSTESLILDLGETKPIASFGFDFILTHGRSATYPTAYTLSLSDDGESWQDILEETELEDSEGNHRFETTEARYVRFQFKTLDNENADELIFGVVRVDGPNYWQKPIFITYGNTIYGDIRDNQLVTGITLKTDPNPLEIWIEVSDDMQTWTPLIEAPILADGEIELPPTEWQYFKIHSTGIPAVAELTIRN